MVRSALCRIDLEDEDANYTIGQLVTHLRLVRDGSEYDKVENLLRRREERVKEKAKKEMEVMVGMYEGKYEEVMKWKVMVEEGLEKFEEEVSVLTGKIGELRKEQEGEKVKVLELLKSAGRVDQGFGMVNRNLRAEVTEDKMELRLEKVSNDLVKENEKLREEVGVMKDMIEEFKRREEDAKLTLELQTKVEIEGSLRVRVKENLDAMERKYKDLIGVNAKLRNEVQVWTKMCGLKEDEVERLRVKELEVKFAGEERMRIKAERELTVLKEKFKESTGEIMKLRGEVKMQRVTIDDIQSRKEVERLLFKEMEVKVAGEERLRLKVEGELEVLKKKIKDSAGEIMKLRDEVNMLRVTIDDIRKLEEDAKVRILELETEYEVEGCLRVRVEEDLEALELKYKEFEMRISAAEKDTSKLMTADLDYHRMKKVARKTNNIRGAGGCSRMASVVDLTDIARPGDTQAGNSVQATTSIIQIIDSEDDTSETLTRFKRKRSRQDTSGKDYE